MKKVVLFLIAIVTLLLSSEDLKAAYKVSVFVEGNLSQLQEHIVNSAFMSRLSTTGGFTAFERNDTFINAVNREHDYQVSGEVPESQIRKVANKYGVDYVIAVSVMFDCDDTYISARLINIVTGKVEKTVSLDRTGTDNKTLKNLANNVAYRLLN